MCAVCVFMRSLSVQNSIRVSSVLLRRVFFSFACSFPIANMSSSKPDVRTDESAKKDDKKKEPADAVAVRTEDAGAGEQGKEKEEEKEKKDTKGGKEKQKQKPRKRKRTASSGEDDDDSDDGDYAPGGSDSEGADDGDEEGEGEDEEEDEDEVKDAMSRLGKLRKSPKNAARQEKMEARVKVMAAFCKHLSKIIADEEQCQFNKRTWRELGEAVEDFTTSSVLGKEFADLGKPKAAAKTAKKKEKKKEK